MANHKKRKAMSSKIVNENSHEKKARDKIWQIKMKKLYKLVEIYHEKSCTGTKQTARQLAPNTLQNCSPV